ncbi:5'-deoxynucleotidase [Marinicrinis sediminis]|uniref:5'-deoxynucleotidase n=1 Tax=Marinicrinis sediminis TaxID=1652465 RepID=A0ABW5R9D8_9BACL
MESDFFAYLYRLRHIRRWSLMRNVVEENVAEHSYHVAVLTHALCHIAIEKYDREISIEKAVSMALFHDATEIFTGDIPTPVKHHNEHLLRNFRQIEELAAQRLLEMLPPELQRSYHPLIFGAESDPELYQYVKAADLLDAYLKCASEISAGNTEFKMAGEQIEQQIKKLDMPEVNYFLTHLAPSFQKTLDELSRTYPDAGPTYD